MRLSLFILFFIGIGFLVMADDLLITRNGTEYRGKLELLSDKEVTFSVKKGGLLKSKSSNHIFQSDDIYLIKTDKRGNIFFNRKRERIMLPQEALGKKADIIYLADGGEIPAWNISLKDGVITYQKSPKQLRANSNTSYIPVKDIFMIKYSDGSKDIFTDITLPQILDDKKHIEKEKKLKVIFYKVLRGESLASIANKYDVSVADLREWNDIPAKTGDSDKLTPGSQLMLQLDSTND